MHDIPAGCLIANPPYIPAPDNNILMPALHGGEDGANLTRVSITNKPTTARLYTAAAPHTAGSRPLTHLTLHALGTHINCIAL